MPEYRPALLLQNAFRQQYLWNGGAAWSPDGSRIAFETNRDGNWEIYVMDANGENARNLTNHPADDTEPAWSPDGTQIAFSSSRVGQREIFVLNAATGAVRRLTYDCARDHHPDWWPGDGYAAPPAAIMAAPLVDAPRGVATVTREINLRAAPNETAELSGSAAENDCLTALAREGNWVQVRTGAGRIAWAAADALDLTWAD